MDDDLVKRLRSGVRPYDTIGLAGVKHDPRCLEAADRIESDAARIRELEAELAALREGRGVTVDELAQIIRTVDGSHNLGAGELAERILSALSPAPVSVGASDHDLVQAAEALVRYQKWPAEAKHPSVYQTLVFSLSAALRALSETEGK